MAASKTIGGINVTISATIDKFQKSMTMARRLLVNFTSKIKDTIFSLKGLAAALSIGAFAKLTANQFEAISALRDLADKTGLTTQKLATYQLAAREAGIDTQVLERALTILAKKGMSLETWIEQTAKLSDGQKQLAAATEMFGTRGASMVRMVTVNLKEARKAAEGTGEAISYAAAAAVDDAADAFGRFKAAAQGILKTVAVDLAPLVKGFSDKGFQFLAANGKGIGHAIATAIIEAVKFIADGIQKIISASLRLIADVREAIFRFRNSEWGATHGLAQTAEGREATINSMFDDRTRYMKFDAQRPWSERMQKLLDDAQKAGNQAIQQNKPGFWQQFYRRLNASTNVFGQDLNGIGALAKSGVLGLGSGLNMLPGLLRQGWWQSLLYGANRYKSPVAMNASPGFNFAESGSPEAYRQQAAIRRGAENLQKKMLGEQQKGNELLARIDRKTLPVGEAGLA